MTTTIDAADLAQLLVCEAISGPLLPAGAMRTLSVPDLARVVLRVRPRLPDDPRERRRLLDEAVARAVRCLQGGA